MRYFKRTDSGYIISVGKGNGGTEITEQEYNEILAVCANKPEATETTDYMLRDDLTWEAYEVESVPDPDPTPEEALAILLGEEGSET